MRCDMALSARNEILAALLAFDEVNGWAGELDGSGHINSFSGVHNWRTDEGEPSEQALCGVLQREVDAYLRRRENPRNSLAI